MAYVLLFIIFPVIIRYFIPYSGSGYWFFQKLLGYVVILLKKRIEELIEEKLYMVFKEPIKLDKSHYAGGMTNNNYIMKIHDVEYVIRQPGFMTEEMIDRRIERINNSIASKLGINSDCIYFDEETGIKISLYIKNSTNIALSDLNCKKNLLSVCNLMKKTHESDQPFPNIFDWTSELKKYETIIESLNGEFFSDYHNLKEKLLSYMEQEITEISFVPCHNDTVPENFITGETGRTYLIDWEYSGMNDPAFDVAAFILESSLTKESIEHLLYYYYGDSIPMVEIKKIQCYMMAQDLLWTAWALIRHYGGDDFLDYCSFRYDRFRKNIMMLTENTNYSIADMVMGKK